MIPQETIDRVRDSVSLVELIREFVPTLRKAGRNFVARCPFHEERTPSFSVNPAMGLFKCFGCGVGGDAFKFVMLMEHLTYPEAIRQLAKRVGVPVPEVRAEKTPAVARERQALLDALETAAAWYHQTLLTSAEGATARDYLKQRGVMPNTWERFRLGYAPHSGQGFFEAATRKGITPEVLEKAGLIRRSDRTGRFHDHLWHRIVFPIQDAQGHVVAFGGRVLEEREGTPKYINSPETPVYSKGRHLYGLFLALPTIRKVRRVIVLEGYMDVIGCHQAGVEEAVATLGTALTADHARHLRRVAEEGLLLFDADTAGEAAAQRGGDVLLEAGVTVRVVSLPQGIDVDEFLLQQGLESFRKLLAEVSSLVEFQYAQAVKGRGGRVTTPEDKTAVADRVLPTIAKIQDPLLQDEWLRWLAEQLGVEKTIMGRKLHQMGNRREPVNTFIRAATSQADVPGGTSLGVRSLEEEILQVLLQEPTLVARCPWKAEEFLDQRCAQVFRLLQEALQGGHPLSIAALTGRLPEEWGDWFTGLAMEDKTYLQPDQVFQGFLKTWTTRSQEVQRRALQEVVARMLEGERPWDQRVYDQFDQLTKSLKGSLKG
ncbi:MAG: DNA primase [Elusimicrobia bacterium]|nr:DNA primase [Elusimicrobiota bacterium]